MNSSHQSLSSSLQSSPLPSSILQEGGKKNKKNTQYPTHFIVQRLNSRGALFLERAEYDKAIDVLVQALRLWETTEEQPSDSSSSSSQQSSSCEGCSIDECILQARHLSPQAVYNRNKNSNSNRNKQLPKDEDDEERFIYRQPILTTKHFWNKDHIPGNTLSLIIILNLAMAHHLSAINTEVAGSGSVCRRKLQKALNLYDLAHQLQIDEGICSPQATLIIANNVGEIHRSVNNYEKHRMCLRHLLSTMMYMVDNHQHESPSSSDGAESQSQPTPEWDGFLRNTTQLILQQNCAGAA